MGSRSHDLGAEVRMHSLTVDCYTFSNEEKVSLVVPVTRSALRKILGGCLGVHQVFGAVLS